MSRRSFDRIRRIVGAKQRVSHAAATDDVEVLKNLLGKTLSFQVRSAATVLRLEQAEFKVSSQFGEDGIIQYLTHVCGDVDRSFVEFGVGDYQQSNTRFLLQNDNWRGLVIEGEEKGIELIRRDPIYAMHALTAVNAFIDASNIDALLEAAGFVGDIGLLSIDIDGNDYWVWKAIHVARPAIVVVEYNAVFGAKRPVSIPYDPRFDWKKAHYSLLYWGTSLPALCHLAEARGYAFVGADSHGLNAFFVRKDRLGHLPALSCEEGFVDSRFRLAHNPDGSPNYATGAERRALIADCPLEDVTTGERLRVGDL